MLLKAVAPQTPAIGTIHFNSSGLFFENVKDKGGVMLLFSFAFSGEGG